MKAVIDGNLIEDMNFAYWLDDFEKKAQRQIRKQKIAELVSFGIDKQIAETMVDCGLA